MLINVCSVQLETRQTKPNSTKRYELPNYTVTLSAAHFRSDGPLFTQPNGFAHWPQVSPYASFMPREGISFQFLRLKMFLRLDSLSHQHFYFSYLFQIALGCRYSNDTLNCLPSAVVPFAIFMLLLHTGIGKGTGVKINKCKGFKRATMKRDQKQTRHLQVTTSVPMSARVYFFPDLKQKQRINF